MSSAAMSDAALVASARAGDREALGALLARHYPAALRLCRRLLGPLPEAQDVAQEAALQALLGLATLRDPARFGPWLHAIAANLARMALRRCRPLSLEQLEEGALVLWPPPAPSPEAVHEAREVHDAVVAALGELPPHERDAAIGFFLEGYSYTELAELLGVPLSTVKGRLFKGRRRLRRALRPLAPTPPPPLRPVVRPRKELPMSDTDLVEVTIESVRKSLMTQHRVVVLRQQDGARDLSIWVGTFEGDMIQWALEGRQTERPMTHDMALRLLASLGAEVRQVVVNKILDTTFYAEITLAAGEQTHVVDARPSDALALAARTGAPIRVARAVMEAAGVDVQGHQEHRLTVEQGIQPSSFRVATWKYIGELALDEPGAFEWDKMAAVDWAARFPTRELALDGETLMAARLAEGDDAAWLVLRPALWQDLTTLAQRLIAQAEALRASLGKGKTP
ncbi:MAG TPA: bifunctional nuclease domain-containing protein [Roseiflexaceae bacterium]|nr:bifunctional nuclease domain-containing protein [Roseiflexaceae bacterium]